MSLSQSQIKSIQDSVAMLAENNLETDKLDNDGEPMTEAQALSISRSTVWLAINGTGISGAIADGFLSDDLAGATIGDVETVISADDCQSCGAVLDGKHRLVLQKQIKKEVERRARRTRRELLALLARGES